MADKKRTAKRDAAAKSDLAEARSPDVTPPRAPGSEPVKVVLQPAAGQRTDDQALWVTIRNRAKAIGFPEYETFVDDVLCNGDTSLKARCDQIGTDHRITKLKEAPRAYYHGVDAYQLLKSATEVFLLLNCGVVLNGLKEGDEAERLRGWAPEEVTRTEIAGRLSALLGSGPLPYLRRIIDAVFKDEDDKDEDDTIPSSFCPGLLPAAVNCPCLLELIWSYWHEEGMLVQSLNAISLRFQNKRGPDGQSGLAQLTLDPLRPMSNLLWGYLQDEPHRLSVGRRAYEYDHHYGLSLIGRAVPQLRSVDSRSKFLEAFHVLLHRAWTFYQEDADTTVVANGFPVLNALKELHMILAEGAHNQFGDLPWTARVEMLIQQWLLSRPEIRDFLRGRPMVPYKESWMAQVDTLKKLEGWTDTSVTHFRDLGFFGEQILLSVRYGDWIDDASTEENAKNWAQYWKPEIQGYLHAYRAVTGVELTNAAALDYTPPAVHLSRRAPKRARR